MAAEFQHVNDMRANTIRALRKNFGSRFIGGIRPTPFAEKNYPDIVMRDPWTLQKHLLAVKTSLVCVTTSGLFNSIDWKLAEYLAASRCAVSERLKFHLPEPLEEERQVLTFSEADQCVEHCARLLGDPALAEHMRHEGQSYYQRNIKPCSIMRNRLHSALAKV